MPAAPAWAVTGTAETRQNLINSIHLEPDVLEAHIRALEAKYREAERAEPRWETWRVDDADVVLVGYGIMGRVLRAVVEAARRLGIRAGLLRPITLYPFPTRAIRALAGTAQAFAVVEMSTGQMVEDVRLALEGSRPVETYGRVGGNIPTVEEVLRFVERIPGGTRQLSEVSSDGH